MDRDFMACHGYPCISLQNFGNYLFTISLSMNVYMLNMDSCQYFIQLIELPLASSAR